MNKCEQGRKNLTQRSANYALKGYLYQFYKTIEQILLSDPETEITAEGIEDIDLKAIDTESLIQCKYHETKRFKPSDVYKPIGLMIKHFIETNPTSLVYTLYAYFDEYPYSNTEWLNDSFLRKALNHVSLTATLSDSQVNSFKSQFRFISGSSFEDLKATISKLLQTEFACSLTEVELYYYNNAVAYIAELSTNTNINNRRIKKKEFFLRINKKLFLFDTWQYQLNGSKAYIKTVRKQLHDSQIFLNTKRRYLFISKELVNSSTANMNIHILLQNLVNQYGIKGQLYNSKLWTVIVDTDRATLKTIKASLIKNNIYFNDGYEEIHFCPKYFNEMPITTKKRTTDNIENSSHDLKLIAASTFRDKFADIVSDSNYPHVIINTERNENINQLFLDKEETGIYHISTISDLSELNEILKKGK